MAYRLEKNETTPDGVRRIALKQIDIAIQEVDNQKIDRHKTVHQVRERCKKLRGLFRLVHPCLAEDYQKENSWYRDSSRALSDIRDAQALIECSEKLLKQYSTTFPAGIFRFERDDSGFRRSGQTTSGTLAQPPPSPRKTNLSGKTSQAWKTRPLLLEGLV